MSHDPCKKRQRSGGTAFTNWLREQSELASNTQVGYVATDIDVVWYNYKKACLMLLEEKHGQEELPPSQRTMLSILHQALSFAFGHPDFRLSTPKGCKRIPPKIRYCGCHSVRFERGTPDDGRVFVDGREMSRDAFIRFLQFETKPRGNSRAELKAALECISQALDAQEAWGNDEGEATA